MTSFADTDYGTMFTSGLAYADEDRWHAMAAELRLNSGAASGVTHLPISYKMRQTA